MIRRFRSYIAVAAAAALLAGGLATGAFAQGDGPRRGARNGGPGRMGGPGLPIQALDLSDAQREQLRAVMQGHREEMQAAGRRLGDAHRAQRAAIETVPVNEGLIRSTSQTLANAQTDVALLQALIHSEAWALLTPDQQAKAKELKAQRETRAQRRRKQ